MTAAFEFCVTEKGDLLSAESLCLVLVEAVDDQWPVDLGCFSVYMSCDGVDQLPWYPFNLDKFIKPTP